VSETTPAPSGDGLVQMAYLHPHTVSHSFHESVMRLTVWDQAHDGHLLGTGGPFMMACSTNGIVEARNKITRQWLDETPHEWLWFVDTDMGFKPDTVDRLLAAADPVERPVMGALCFGVQEIAYDGMGGRRLRPAPTIYMPNQDAQGRRGFSTRWHYPKNTVLQVGATGAACLLIHRGTAEKVRAQYGDAWFDPFRYDDGRRLGEDLSFCARLGSAAIPVFVHTGVKTTHHKQMWVGEDDYTPPAEAPVPAHAPVPDGAEPETAAAHG